MTTITDYSGSAAHSDLAALPREGAAHAGTGLGRPTSHGLGGLRLWAGLRTALLAVLLICALPLARVPTMGVAHADAAITLTPTAGPPSTTATLSGSGFGATEVVTVTFDGTLVGAATSSATGGIAALSFIVPNPVAAGAHTVAVRGSSSGQTQSAIFTVTGAPSLALTPSTGNPGSTVSLSGGGFGPSEPLTVGFDGAQVAVGATTGTGALASITFTVPNPLAAGAHTVTVRGTTSGLTANATFTAQTAPTLKVNVASSLPGSTLVISGSGFSAGETVIVQFDTTVVRVAPADAAGAFGDGPITPQSSAVGVHTLTARGQSSGLTASVPFTIVAPLTVTPVSGPAGSTAVVSTAGLRATEAITISFDGTQVAAGTTDGAGAIATLPFTVPNPVAAGAHTVTVRGTTSGLLQSTPFTVTSQPTLVLTPNAGAPGSAVTLSGGGFGPSEPVTLSVDGAQVATGTSNGAGSISGLGFNAPNPLAAGAHTVVVRGTTSGLTARATFTAQTAPALTLSVPSGLPGAAVTVSGRGFGASETVTIQLDTTVIATTRTDAQGIVGAVAGAVPATTAGAHTVTAHGQQSGLTASVPFTVVSPAALRVSPTTATVGSTVAIAVTGFSPGELVVLSARGVTLATANADGSGALGSLSVTVPAAPRGALTMTARGATSGRTATATVTITPLLAASTMSATAGMMITLTGRGFGVNESIEIMINGVSLSRTVADASGSFANASITLPATLSAATYTLTARGATGGESAGVPVAIARPLVLSLARSTTIAGGLVTISGHGFAASAPITLRVDGAQVLATSSDSQGMLRVSVVLPSTLGVGRHILSSQVGSTGRQAQTAVTIVAPQARVARTFHFVGTALPHLGAPLLSLNGILTVQAETGTGDFTGHARLRLDDGTTVLAPAGWLLGATLHLRIADGPVLLIGQGAAVSPNRTAGVFTAAQSGQTLGFWAATRATTADVVSYTFSSQTTSGPDNGQRVSGTLDLLGDTYGGLIGFLRLPDGTIDPVSGQQVNGNLNMQVIVRAGTPFFVVGTAAQGGFSGVLAGPLAGDSGAWIARPLGAALPLPRTQAGAVLPALPMPVQSGLDLLARAGQPSGALLAPLTFPTRANTAAGAGPQTFHLAGTLLPRVGAPLAPLNGILYVQPSGTAGALRLTVSINQVLIPARGSLSNNTLTLRFTYNGLSVTGQALMVSGNRFAGALTQGQGGQTLGFWAATRATTADVVHSPFSAQITTGPDRGTRYAGTLDLLSDAYGGLLGFLHLPDGTVDAVSGQQVNGNLNMQVIVRAGTPFFVVGTAAFHGFSGALAGPLAGDRGSWTLIQ